MSELEQRAKEIFEAARKLPPKERADYLDSACGGDTQLRQRIVEALFKAQEREAATAQAPASPSPEETIVVSSPIEAPGEKPGDRIGRYKLLERLPEGGMGTVWVAEQSEPVRRKVALKVIKLGMDTRQVMARFEAERQALALMNHPNIAKVLDAGATEKGRPFFVMELVSGEPITTYCDRQNLPTHARLELFVQVCRAVQHAHQKGIIHRDIKPSNILVALQDGVPVPKVIDFGIAKATAGQRLTDKTLYTALEQFIGTPAYMSPEQAEMAGLDIDTRSDIYSLGVMLYELLTSKMPFDPKRLVQAGLDEMRRIIREEEPAWPSTRISTLEVAEQTTVARRRQSEPPKLIHQVQGDLDWIVMKCLEKDRTRRYETANGLAVDIQRHLSDELVVARPPSQLYRFQKMVRRHKLVFAAGAAVVTALVLGLGFATWSSIRERKMRQRAELAEQKATDEAARADRNAAEEKVQRRLAQDKAAEAKTALSTSDFHEALRLIADNHKSDAMGYLVRSLSANPANAAAATRLATLLIYGQWLMPIFCLETTNVPSSADFSPDGRRIVTTDGPLVRFWDVDSGKPVTEPIDNGSPVASTQFSLDGKRVLIISRTERSVRVWDANTGLPVTAPLSHDSRIQHAQFGAAGERIVTVCSNRTVRIWDSGSGKPVGELLRLEALEVAKETEGHEIQRSVPNRLQLGQPGPPDVLQSSTNIPMSYLLSPDGNSIAVFDRTGGTRIWDLVTGQLMTTFEGGHLSGGSQVREGVEFSPDGKYLLNFPPFPRSVSTNNFVQIWDAHTGHLVTRISTIASRIHKAHFSPDGKRIVIVSSNEAAVWDARTGDPVTEPLRHDDRVLEARFNPDGSRVVTASLGTLKIWSVPGGRQVAEEALEIMSPLSSGLRGGYGVSSELFASPWVSPQVGFSSDGSRIIARWGDYGGSESSISPRVSVRRLFLTAWRLQSSQVLPEPLEHDRPVISAQFSPDGKRILSASSGTAWAWDAQTGQRLTEVRVSAEPVTSTDLSPDGSRFVTTSTNIAQLWKTETGQPVTDPMEHDGLVGSAQFSPDGKRILTFSEAAAARARDAATNSVRQPRISGLYSTLRVWDAETGRPLAKLMRPERSGTLSAVGEVSPDGQRIVAWGRLWDAQTGARVGELRDAIATTVRFSPDAGHFLIAQEGGAPAVWDAHSGKRLRGRLTEGVGFLTISPDWSRIATAMPDDTVRICDAETGEPLTEPLLKQGTNVFSVQFSPDGKRVLTLSQDKAQVWNARTGQPLTEPFNCDRPTDNLSAVGRALLHLSRRSPQFSSDGTRIVVCCGGLRVCDVGPLGEKCPDWLLPLAEAVSGKRLTSAGVFEPTRLNRGTVVSNIRQKLNQTPDDKDEWTAWGRWLLADPATRTISPYSKITVADYIQRRIKENTAESLDETEQLACGNLDLLERISGARKKLEAAGGRSATAEKKK